MTPGLETASRSDPGISSHFHVEQTSERGWSSRPRTSSSRPMRCAYCVRADSSRPIAITSTTHTIHAAAALEPPRHGGQSGVKALAAWRASPRRRFPAASRASWAPPSSRPRGVMCCCCSDSCARWRRGRPSPLSRSWRAHARPRPPSVEWRRPTRVASEYARSNYSIKSVTPTTMMHRLPH